MKFARVLGLAALTASIAAAQTAAALAPSIQFQLADGQGRPYSGAKVCTYTAGTSTPKATYTDYTKTTTNANPTILDSRGAANIWIGADQYKFLVLQGGDGTCATGSTIVTRDFVSDTGEVLKAALAASGGASLIGFTPTGAASATTVGTFLNGQGFMLDTAPYSPATFAAACAAAVSAQKTLTVTTLWAIPTGTYACDLQFYRGGKLRVAASGTATMTGSISCGAYSYCFDTTTNATAAIVLSKFDGFTPMNFGATGDGSHDDTAGVQATVDTACNLATGTGNTASARVVFPTPPVYYKWTSVSVCANNARIELAGDRSKVVASGTAFVVASGNNTLIHGFNLFGDDSANHWGIKCAGNGGSGCISFHVFDNIIQHFGDAATASGGGVWIANNSEKAEVNSNGIYNYGTGIRCDNGCGDQATFHDNKIQDLAITSSTPGDPGNTAKSTCIVISGTTGTAKQTVFTNNLVCNSGLKVSGTGSITIENNEAESFQTVTNSSNAVFEVLAGTGTIFATVKNNYVNMHDLSKRGFYIDSSSATSYVRENNCVPMQGGGGQVQYCIYNGNSNLTTFYQNNGMFLPAPNARLYEFPNDPGIINTPPASYGQTDSGSLVRAMTAAYANLNTLSAASWAANVATYTCVGCNVKTGQLVQIITTVPSTWNINKGQCFATYISADQFSCPLVYDPGTWVSGGTVSALRGSTLSFGDVTFNPYDIGTTLLRKNAGSANGESWAHSIQNSGASDAVSIGESSSSYTTGGAIGWLPNSTTFIYFPSKFRLGTGTGATPTILSDGVGKAGFGGIPVYANNAAAIVGGLTAGMFYRTGADPDPVMVVH